MKPSRTHGARDHEGGFSIVELIVVTGIIVIMAAVAIPRISRYFRSYQMNSAVREVTGEIQAARNRAVMKNVNFGSVFYIRSANTYRTAMEDHLGVPRLPRALQLTEAENTATYPGQVSPLRTLPGDVRFGTGCRTDVGGVALPAPNDVGIRFTRLGQSCDPGTNVAAGQCRLPLVAPAGTPPLIHNADPATAVPVGAYICLVQPSTGLRRLIRISPGGRVVSRNVQG